MNAKRERREFLLSPKASEMVDRLSVAYRCNFSDVIEGLLLGNVKPMDDDHPANEPDRRSVPR
jgi:hypothetical protein